MRVLVLLLMQLLFFLSPAAAQGNSFFDAFTTLDPKRWQLSDGWANGDHMGCVWSKDHIRLVERGVELLLTDTPRGARAFSCGELMSRPMFGFGTYEVRMKPAPLNPGIVSAFFTYTGRPHGNPHDEIDFEFVGARARSVDASYYANDQSNPKDVPLDFDARSGFHDYAYHWTPDRVTWYANGKIVREIIRTADKPFPTTPGKLYISIWNGTPMLNGWLGQFAYPGKPLVASYRYIAYTKLGEDCQFPQSIVCKLGKDKLNRK